MRRFIWICLAMLVCIPFAISGEEDPEGEWVDLFNGKNLDGWTAKIKGHPAGDNFGNTFRAEDGLLKVRYDKYGNQFKSRFGHLFYDTPHSNYVLRVKYRFIGEQLPNAPSWANRNSGIMIHGETPEEMGKNQNFPVSIEVQLLGGSGNGKRPTANVCTPGTHIVMNGNLVTRHCTSSSSPTFHGDEWVTVEVEVHGNRLIRHLVNGEPVLKYSHPQLDPNDTHAKELMKTHSKMIKGGSISLQSESHPIDFKKVQIRPLP